jgi:hypothetical protein
MRPPSSCCEIGRLRGADLNEAFAQSRGGKRKGGALD